MTVDRKTIDPEGTFEAAGSGTDITSRHYDVVIEDDTVAPKKDKISGLVKQPTQNEIEKAIGFHKLVHPLLVHPTKSQIVVVGTRWAVRDLLGWLDVNAPEYFTINRKAREGGVAIWDRFNEDVLNELERVMGPYMYAMLLENTPTASINQVFKRE